jgi:hypothetical protein
MTASFRKGALAEHKRKYLLEREKVRLPQFQDRARLYKTIEEKYYTLHDTYIAWKGNTYNTHPLIVEKERRSEVLSTEEGLARVKLQGLVYGGAWGMSPELTNAYHNGIFRSDPTDAATLRVRDSLGYDNTRVLFDKAMAITAETKRLEKESRQFEAENKAELDLLIQTLLFKQEYDSMAYDIKEHVRASFGHPYPFNEAQFDGNSHLELEHIVQLAEELGEGCLTMSGQGQLVKKAVVIHCGCPVEECKGFVGAEWKCGMCGVQVCKTCRDVVVAEGAGPHKCDSEKVETAKMLARETKPCPNCAALIYKTDGCDQMWCTQCHTTFSWVTGQKEEGRVHNPHYYEWLRRTQGAVPREPARPGDVGYQCGENDLRPFDMNRTINKVAKRAHISKRGLYVDVEPLYHMEALEVVAEFYRLLTEVRAVNLSDTATQTYENRRHEQLEKYAIEFLAGESNESEWAQWILGAERDFAFNMALYQVYQMFYSAGKDIYNSISDTAPIGQALKQLVALRAFALEELAKVYKRFDSKVPSRMLEFHFGSLFRAIQQNASIQREKTSRWLEGYVDFLVV